MAANGCAIGNDTDMTAIRMHDYYDSDDRRSDIYCQHNSGGNDDTDSASHGNGDDLVGDGYGGNVEDGDRDDGDDDDREV